MQAGSTVSLDARDRESGLSLADKIPAKQDDQRNIEEKEALEILEKTISTLPDKYKEIFLLHAIEGFTHQEISKILKINPATVRTDYRRANLILREKIDKKRNK